MKTIKVTNKMYKDLMELSKEMVSQDPRCTRMPHMFQIRTREQVAAYEGQGEDIWVDEDGCELTTDEEIKEFIQQDIYENDPTIDQLDDENARKQSKLKVEELEYLDELEDYLENHRNNYRKVAVTTEDKYVNTFFTAKACEAHIKANDYHYREPVCYLNHAWRNPEMELVSKFLCEISGGKLHL